MKTLRIWILLLSTTASMSGCEWIESLRSNQEGDEEEKVVLARVYENYLYYADLKGMITKSETAQDSLDYLNRHVDNWVKKQLILHEAEKKSRYDEKELQQRLLDYKYQLLVHEYQRQYVNENLNKDIPVREINAYYESNKANFELKKNIVKSHFVKLSDNDPKVEDVRRWIKSDRGEDLNKLQDHCYQFADSYSLNDSVWVEFDELVLGTPISPDTYLKNRRFIEASDSSSVYFLRIFDLRMTDEVSPLEFVRDQIEAILLNRRKLQLQDQLETKILNTAKHGRDFEVKIDN